MSRATLSSVSQRIQIGQALPFGVLDADGGLLLARGQQVVSAEQLLSLMSRGAMVNLAEVMEAASGTAAVKTAARAELPPLWSRCLERVSQTLLQMPEQGFTQAIDDASAPVTALVARDPELAIFQVLREGGDPDVAYGVRRSMQTAVTAFLIAQRLAWEPAECERAFKVALTMNVSMLGLQGQLARQPDAPTDQQRQELRNHPMRSVQMLQAAGVNDHDWLDAVLNHHEQEDGAGYPSGRTDVCELASLVRRAGHYTAKLASRSGRDAISADVAGRQMFMQDPGHPMTAALVREFGIYPPGCFVRLVSGERALVVQRGASITTPVVMCLTDAQGDMLAQPRRVAVGEGGHAVAGVVGEGAVNARLSLERLAALVTA
ncbi:MAG: hypothetical protein M3Y32_03265 [Pseudomonadota bacterium]|nr:hypothetical protein [Pseudomonadota bacterium]